MKEIEVRDEKGNLVGTLERPDCWGEMTEDTDERGCDDCLYGEECMEATSDIVEESQEETKKGCTDCANFIHCDKHIENGWIEDNCPDFSRIENKERIK